MRTFQTLAPPASYAARVSSGRRRRARCSRCAPPTRRCWARGCGPSRSRVCRSGGALRRGPQGAPPQGAPYAIRLRAVNGGDPMGMPGEPVQTRTRLDRESSAGCPWPGVDFSHQIRWAYGVLMVYGVWHYMALYTPHSRRKRSLVDTRLATNFRYQIIYSSGRVTIFLPHAERGRSSARHRLHAPRV
jgi:hypothetical protein